MARVTGLGGFFFKSLDPQALAAWYKKHLDLAITDFGGAMYGEDEKRAGFTLWMPFKADSNHFGPSSMVFMVNLRGVVLLGVLLILRCDGVLGDADVQVMEYG